MMVPPPWFISWEMRSWDGAWASGVCIGGNVGVCIGRNVMVVVFRWVDIRCWAVLSIVALLVMVLVVWVLEMSLVLRQADIRSMITAVMRGWIGRILFMVFVLCFSVI